jgi:predicted secreted protein
MSIGYLMELRAAGLMIGKARNVDLSLETKLSDITTRDSAGWSESEPAQKSWSVDVDALYVSTNTGLRTLLAAWINDTIVAVILYDEEGNAQTGNAYVKSCKRGEPQDDSVSLAISLQGTGALTDATPDS